MVDDEIRLVPFPDHMVYAVDRIVQRAKDMGAEGRVETTKHWDLVEDLFKLWVRYFPGEYQTYYDQQVKLKRAQLNKHGSVREAGGAEIQHVVEIPTRFFRLLEGIFPDVDRQLTGSKDFAIKLATRMPIMKVGEKV